MTTVATPPRPRRRWLRFSLRTLLLATLLAGSGGALWTHLEPWVCVRTVPFGLAELWVSPDGRTLCAIQNRGTKVHILDADTLEQRAICDNSTWKFEALSFSLDSRRILTTCNNLDDTGAKHEKEKYLFVWDADSGKQLAAITRPGGHSDINFARFSPDAKKLIAIQNSDSKVLFYAIADGSLIRKISEAEVSVLCPKQPSPEEQKVIDETTSRATAQAERAVTLDEFTRAVVQLHVPGALSSDGRWLLTYLHGQSLIWDVESARRRCQSTAAGVGIARRNKFSSRGVCSQPDSRRIFDT